MSKKHLHNHKEQFEEQENERETELESEAENTECALNPDNCKALICPTCTIHKEAEDTRIRALAEMEISKNVCKKKKTSKWRMLRNQCLQTFCQPLTTLIWHCNTAVKMRRAKTLLWVLK